jgi:hypothetical protein
VLAALALAACHPAAGAAARAPSPVAPGTPNVLAPATPAPGAAAGGADATTSAAEANVTNAPGGHAPGGHAPGGTPNAAHTNGPDGPPAAPAAQPEAPGAIAAAAGAVKGKGAKPAGAPAAASVAQVLDARVPVGRLVRVRGRCLGYGARGDAGPPPRTRSDWLLSDAGRAVYVVGAFPAGCEPMAGGPTPVEIVARVAADTVAGLGGPGRPRRYLVRQAGGA